MSRRSWRGTHPVSLYKLAMFDPEVAPVTERIALISRLSMVGVVSLDLEIEVMVKIQVVWFGVG